MISRQAIFVVIVVCIVALGLLYIFLSLSSMPISSNSGKGSLMSDAPLRDEARAELERSTHATPKAAPAPRDPVTEKNRRALDAMFNGQ